MARAARMNPIDIAMRMRISTSTDGVPAGNGDPTNASGAVVGFTMYVATDKLVTEDNFSPKPETVTAAGA